MNDALRVQPNPHDPVSGAERLAQSIAPHLRVPVYAPEIGDPVLAPACGVPDCPSPRTGPIGLCPSHRTLFERVHGKRPVDATPDELRKFMTTPEVHGGPRAAGVTLSFQGLPDPLANELRLFVQDRQQAGRGKLSVFQFNLMKRTLQQAGVTSIFQDNPYTPLELVMTAPKIERLPAWFKGETKAIAAMFRQMMSLVAPYYAPVPILQRDAWTQADFGVASETLHHEMRLARFNRVQHEWFKAWLKQYADYHIKVGRLEWTTIVAHLNALVGFDRFMTDQGLRLQGPQDIERGHLERYLLWVRTPGSRFNAAITQKGAISVMRGLLELHHDLEWQPPLRPSAHIRLGEAPVADAPLPQPVDPFVLKQLMSPEFLSSIEGSVASALVIARYHGLRMSSLVQLKFDCVRYSDQGPVLRYRNVKLRRDAEQPVMQQAVLDAIHAQQQRVLKRFPDGNTWLFPARRENASGGTRVSTTSMHALFAYHALAPGRLVGRDGQPTRFSFGQLRDTVATELLNKGLPSALVAAWLDHKNTKSLNHYCRMQADTLRTAVDQTPQLNIQGEDVRQAIDGGLQLDVEFWRDSIRLATSTVPGGVCRLPVRESCPHHNACYTCALFVTTPQHLPQHLAHLQQAEMLAVAHEQQGKTRMAEKDRQTASQLRTIVRVLLDWMDRHPVDATNLGMGDWLLAHEASVRLAANGATHE